MMRIMMIMMTWQVHGPMSTQRAWPKWLGGLVYAYVAGQGRGRVGIKAWEQSRRHNGGA